MVLAHGVMDSHKMLIFHMFYGDSMALFRFFRFQRRQGNTAATDDGAAYGVDYVAANGTDIEPAPDHIPGGIPVDDGFSVHQFDHRYSQRL